MFSSNFTTLTGNLGSDPELRYFQSGKAICNFALAVSTGKDKPADWFDIQCWNASAERAAKLLRKGDRAVITGSLKQERWRDKQTGAQRSKVVVNAGSIELIARSRQAA